MSVLFSIVMPVYNNEKYFPLAVQSILGQEFTDFELIIIDDGSTDHTPEIADKMAEKDQRIRVIHQSNQWIYASFNNGIQEALGDYIYIVNSDDKLAEGALLLMAEKVEKYHPDIIWTKTLIYGCDENQNVICDKGYKKQRSIGESLYLNKEEVEKGWIYFMSSGLAGDQANLYRREIMQSQPFRNDVYAADALYNISIADKIHTALILQEPIYLHFIYESDKMNAATGKYYPYVHKMHNDIYREYQSLFQSWGLKRDDYAEEISRQRMARLTGELRTLQYASCPMSLDEKLQYSFNGCIDEVIMECVSETDRREELESRILSVTRELLIKEQIRADSEMYFAYELLESLLCYEKDEEDLRKIQNAIEHPGNPYHIGKIFYKKLLCNGR